jgi:hypothetical protein
MRLVHAAAGAAVRRLGATIVAVAATIGALAALVAAGCSSSPGNGSGPLVWAAPPLEFTPETLPGERILTGRLRNEGLRRLRVDLPDLRIRDASGADVAAQPIFLQTFGRSLWSPGRGPEQLPETELLRTGRIAWLEPGEAVPFTLAWRRPAAPARIEYEEGWIPIR